LTQALPLGQQLAYALRRLCAVFAWTPHMPNQAASAARLLLLLEKKKRPNREAGRWTLFVPLKIGYFFAGVN
jgi:hypothetical protein